jgi:predicted RNA-binding Zn ribbon-like protein
MVESPVIEFLNTRRGGKRGAADAVDSLHSFDDLTAWAVRYGIITRPDAGPSSDSEQARRGAFALSCSLRSVLDTYLTAKDAAARQKLARRLNDVLKKATMVTEIRASENAIEQKHRFRTRTAANVPVAIAIAILRFLESVPLEQIKRCEAGDCIWFFVDATKNGSRRWCSGELCGARHRARKHYRKIKTASDARI